ncbi:T-cell surface antigen CD2-like isoform X2 [Onychostoma macrolepis]|uniref:T-cell surface antigen CD2-like isoform X2 n=1 Tax=Onychostoma macrolepis TaxID=369639 RepID=UPI00272D7D91|nr:T-cell surface antigen CD2-like isoform X2 [Onychostoma macrolepis]
MENSDEAVYKCVFPAETNGIQSVMEGDSVTLNSDLTEMLDDDLILWRFGPENTLIAEIDVMADSMTVYDDVLDGRFRDRLKLDSQTGSLTIINTRTEHTGRYKLDIKRVIKNFSLTVYGVLPVPVISSNSSQCSSSSNCSLVCSVVNVSDVTLSWFKGNSLLSSISVSDFSISLSLPLEVEYQDKNTYSCVLNNPISNQTRQLNITQLCHTSADQGLPLLYMVMISAGSLLIVAAVVFCCICKKCRKTVETQEEDRRKTDTLSKPTKRKTLEKL